MSARATQGAAEDCTSVSQRKDPGTVARNFGQMTWTTPELVLHESEKQHWTMTNLMSK